MPSDRVSIRLSSSVKSKDGSKTYYREIGTVFVSPAVRDLLIKENDSISINLNMFPSIYYNAKPFPPKEAGYEGRTNTAEEPF